MYEEANDHRLAIALVSAAIDGDRSEETLTALCEMSKDADLRVVCCLLAGMVAGAFDALENRDKAAERERLGHLAMACEGIWG